MRINNVDNFDKNSKRNRLILFILFLLVISFMSLGHALFNTILEVSGSAGLIGRVGELEITGISVSGTPVNGTSNGSSFYTNTGSDGNVTLVAEFDMNFYRTMGSSNSLISYDIIIKNNSLSEKTLTSINSTPTFSSGNSTLDYEYDGITVSTSIIAPGEEIVVNLSFSLDTFERYTNYTVHEVFEFYFGEVTDNTFKLNLTLNNTSVEFSSLDEVVPISVSVSNISSSNIEYNFSTGNTNFLIVNSNGDTLDNFTIDSYTSDTVQFYIKISDEHLFSNLTFNVDFNLDTYSPLILNYDLGSVSVTVPTEKVLEIISSDTVYDDSTIDFTQTSSTSGLYTNSVSGETTYFYRGNVDDNYVSFAGYMWRIIRIDKYGVRVILDSVIDTYSTWGSNDNATSLENAISELTYANSDVKTVVDNWYTSELSSYSSYINPSLFCIDTGYQSMTSSGNAGATVYYFGSYIRNGTDSDGYTPEFQCDSQYVKEYNIGLISGDEVAFAGGLFNNSNTNYYLYNSSISTNWWTLSPAYYDPSLTTVGMLLVNGSNGNFYDWPNGDTIENSFGVRPVITLDASKISGTLGTYDSPYTFS